VVEIIEAPVEGFGMIPNWLVRESTISAYGLLVYVALTGRTNRSGECWPSYATLAKEARCSPASARRAVKELRDAGLVTVTQRKRESDGAQTSNIYRVNLGAPLSHRQSPLSHSKGAPVSLTPKEDTGEQDTGEEEIKVTLTSDRSVKSTLSSGRPRSHRDDVFASPAQIAFMRDCYILLHQELPDRSEEADWAQMSSSDIHGDIRLLWGEIEQGSDHLLEDALLMHPDALSDRALRFIAERTGQTYERKAA
jgi:hypothetical protein